jgi:hypothetical protein
MSTTALLTPARPTYADMVDRDGTIRTEIVQAIAEARAHREIAACAAINWVREWRVVLAEQLVLVGLMAKTRRDSILAAKERATLHPVEQAARSLELSAELARTAIPPRKAEAISLACRADALRATIAMARAAE